MTQTYEGKLKLSQIGGKYYCLNGLMSYSQGFQQMRFTSLISWVTNFFKCYIIFLFFYPVFLSRIMEMI